MENSCHHVLDVTFQEDHCEVRDTNAAQNLSILREMALRALKSHPSTGTMRATLDPFYCTQLIAGITHPFWCVSPGRGLSLPILTLGKASMPPSLNVPERKRCRPSIVLCCFHPFLSGKIYE